MKSQNRNRKEKGVVLLLILGLMAMFSMMVLAFMIVTSNMAESARLSAQIEENALPDAKSDLDTAIRNLVIGSNNRMNPIAPFSILENLYGDMRDSQDLNNTYQINAVITASEALQNYGTNNKERYFELDLLMTNASYVRDDTAMLDQFERIGSVITFGEIYNAKSTPIKLPADYGLVSGVNKNPDMPNVNFTEYWNSNIAGTSALVIGKYFKDPDPTRSNTWRVRIAPNEAMYRMFEKYGNWTLSNLTVCQVRFNQPAFSGTGAGYFSPDDPIHGHDEQSLYYIDSNNNYFLQFGVPFYAYGNAAAPDLALFSRFYGSNADSRHLYGARFDYDEYYDNTGSVFTAQTFWMHLKDGLYRNNSNSAVRMNPAYTAPDERSLFLGWYPMDFNQTDFANYFFSLGYDSAKFPTTNIASNSQTMRRENWFGVIPSFLRPWKMHERYAAFQYDTAPGNPGAGNYGKTYQSIFSNANLAIDAMTVVRKLTPRPLPFDHWNFSGGNDYLDLDKDLAFDYYTPKQTPTVKLASNDIAKKNQIVRNYLTALRGQRTSDGNNFFTIGWDVDNDNDGFKEGIWIPSGLPIRFTPEGQPYATMFSYTVVDMDGKININTAGSWDQIPFRRSGNATLLKPYQSLDDLITLKKSWSGTEGWENTLGPCFYTESLEVNDTFQNQFGWLNDTNAAMDKTSIRRGTGNGPAGLNLAFALENLGVQNFLTDVGMYQSSDSNINELLLSNIASSILWRRNAPPELKNNINLSGRIVWNNSILSDVNMYQPGKENKGNTNDALSYRFENEVMGSLYEFIDPVSLYTNSSNTIQSDYHYPNRGKMSIPYGGNTRVSPWKDDGRDMVPYDYSGSGLKSYDPLGHEMYTYGAIMSDNPYRLLPVQNSVYDNPYSVGSFERIMRPSDSDSGTLAKETVYDLLNLWALDNTLDTNNTSSNNKYYAEFALGTQNAMNLITKIRHTLTPVSSDIPVADVNFPDRIAVRREVDDGAGNITYDPVPPDGVFNGIGAYGIISLLRKCVYSEFAKCKIFCKDLSGLTGGDLTAAQNFNDALDEKVNSVALYLASLMPEEILAGQRIDLNKLAGKAYWQDLDWDAANNKYIRNTAMTNFYSVTASDDQRMGHAYGLAKKMEYARSLYILLMAMTYQDRNASLGSNYWQTTYFPNDNTKKLEDYIEGAFEDTNLTADLLQTLKGVTAFTGTDEADYRKEIQEELMANRIAQWCVNLIDFSDTDAAMTPFFYDTNPFDGWWNTKTPLYKNMTITDFNYTPLFGYDNSVRLNPQNTGNFSPKEKMLYFFTELLARPDTEISQSLFLNGTMNYIVYKDNTSTETAPTNPTFAQYCKSWMMSANDLDAAAVTDKIKLQFRQVWGMERPDLLLTETLNFHDLGVADTEWENNNYDDNCRKVQDGCASGPGGSKKYDYTFDQVVRPEGSSYLELYSTANPNVPQSPDLYDYVNVCDLGSHPLYLPDTNSGTTFNNKRTVKRWQLNLSKRTPEASVTNNAVTKAIPFPVWRVAISCPAVWGDGADTAKVTQASPPIINTTSSYLKNTNSILQRIGTDKDSILFSFQPKQFRKFPSQWEAFDIPQSSVLGPTYSLSKKDSVTLKKTFESEIELERYVWFGDYSDKISDLASLNLEETKRIFHWVKESWSLKQGGTVNSDNNVWLGANQYLVVGPDRDRAIGSLSYNSTSTQKFGEDSPNKVSIRNYIYLIQSNQEKVQTTVNGIPDLKSINMKYMLAGSLLDTANSTMSRFNISEPLWESTADPYATVFGTFDFANANVTSNDKVFPDEPYDMPKVFYREANGSVKNKMMESMTTENDKKAEKNKRPIADDHLFGIGTVPGYKSAFLQRVADPSRPYHPLMNPYITVDWNMMDLTVFNGESVENTSWSTGGGGGNPIDYANFKSVINDTDYTYAFYNDATGSAGDKPNFKYGDAQKPANVFNGTLSNGGSGGGGGGPQAYPLKLTYPLGIAQGAQTSFDHRFSSRQWGRDEQKAFKPDKTSVSNPNPWARGINLKLLKTTDASNDSTQIVSLRDKTTFGLEPWTVARDSNGNSMTAWSSLSGLSVPMYPANTLGGFNDETKVGLNPAYYAAGTTTARGSVYLASPKVPFEYLTWNDAPFDNPVEIALCPSSGPGRFGLEFIRRNENAKYSTEKMFDREKLVKTSLGTGGYTTNTMAYFGYDYTKEDNDPATASTRKMPGPYFNFFHGSDVPGESLNLSMLTEFFRVGSKYASSYTYGGKEYAPDTAAGNANDTGSVLYPTLREPGKINLNTMGKSGLWGLDLNVPYLVFDECRNFLAFQPSHSGMLNLLGEKTHPDTNLVNETEKIYQTDFSVMRRYPGDTRAAFAHLTGDFNDLTKRFTDFTETPHGNLSAVTAEMQRLTGMTTNRSNVFAAWITVGYFEAEKCNPGVNMPRYAPDGTDLSVINTVTGLPTFLTDTSINNKYYYYYKAIYPDGYTYGKELDINSGLTRKRGFYMIDRSIPVEFRRGESSNWRNTLLLDRVIN